MLREWHSPTALSCWANEVSEDDSAGEDIVTWSDPDNNSRPDVGEHLSTQQLQDVHTLWNTFSSVMSETPGLTSIAEHRIHTGTAQPVRLPPYRIPHAFRETVDKELVEMEQAGTIERSSSEWAAHIVLVKKKDSTLRLCVDYRRLNAVSQTDAYPMPRIDELIDRLGDAKYITTRPLTRILAGPSSQRRSA